MRDGTPETGAAADSQPCICTHQTQLPGAGDAEWAADAAILSEYQLMKRVNSGLLCSFAGDWLSELSKRQPGTSVIKLHAMGKILTGCTPACGQG